MLNRDMSKSEIETILNSRGDFVQMDYITKLMNQELSLDMKKFLYLKLANIYEKKSMFKDAAKIYNNLAIISIAFSEKIKHYLKEAQLYIKVGAFDSVEYAMKKAFREANTFEKQDIYRTIKNLYKNQAKIYEKELRRANALKIYEKLLEMNITEAEKQEIMQKLLELYEKLGKLKEYYALKKINEKFV